MATQRASSPPRHPELVEGCAIIVAAASSLAIFAAAPASAQPSAPVQITTCKVLQYVNTARRPYWYWYGTPLDYGVPVTDGIQISYVNRASTPATRVAFVVNYRGDNERVVDAGTFSPGVSINHTFGAFTGLAYLGDRPNTCRVAAVRFADGTAWRSPRRQAGTTQ